MQIIKYFFTHSLMSFEEPELIKEYNKQTISPENILWDDGTCEIMNERTKDHKFETKIEDLNPLSLTERIDKNMYHNAPIFMTNYVIDIHNINKYVVIIDPRKSNIIHIPSMFKHVFNYDYGKCDNVDSTKIYSANVLHIYLSNNINSNTFKREFNKISNLIDVYDIDLLLEMIIENRIISKSLMSIDLKSSNDYEPTDIICIDKADLDSSSDSKSINADILKTPKVVKKYQVILTNDISSLTLASIISIQIYDLVFKIYEVNKNSLTELYLTLYDYYTNALKTIQCNGSIKDVELINSKIEWVISDATYNVIIPSLFTIKNILSSLNQLISCYGR